MISNIKIKSLAFKRGSLSTLNTWNTPPKAGEPVYCTDNGMLKIGDGVTKWKDLPGISGGGGVIYANTSEFPDQGDAGMLYIGNDTHHMYRWVNGHYESVVLEVSGGSANMD